jgi:hypothetical protein
VIDLVQASEEELSHMSAMGFKLGLDVFVLGAGFSRAVSQRMPLMGDLSDGVRVALNDKLEDRHRRHADNIETFLTYLVSAKPWISAADRLRDEALFLDASVRIARFIEAVNLSDSDVSPWLDKIVRTWVSTKAHVITLNYDLTVEDAFQRLDATVDLAVLYPVVVSPLMGRVGGTFSGRMARSLQLYKLHGSINWLYSGSPGASGEPLYRGKPTDEVARDKVPLIAPPVFDKSVYWKHESLVATWRFAGRALAWAKRVIFIGYSLPETDLSMRCFIRDSCHPDTSVVVVNRDGTVRDRYESLGLKMDPAVYSGDTAVADFVDWYVRSVS